MKNYGPTIFAYLLLVVSLIFALYINDKQISSFKNSPNDVEIIIKKTNKPENLSSAEGSKNNIRVVNEILIAKLDLAHERVTNVIDSYEYEIAAGWREILNNFEYLEYYKSLPEAFIRRLIYLPTFTGRKDYDDIDIDSKPKIYPDNDYRSFKYRVSFVPNVIEGMKSVVNYFYYRVKVLLVLLTKSKK